MKLQIIHPKESKVFTAYGEGYVEVDAVRYDRSLVVLPNRVIENWTMADPDSLSSGDFAFLAALDAEIILLGAGARSRIFHPERLRALIRAGKGCEIMDTHAACRTYNILVGEGRKVAAALILNFSVPPRLRG